MKVFGIIVLIKLFGIIVILASLRELQIQFGIGVAMLVLLHVAAATALVLYLQGRIRFHGLAHANRTQEEDDVTKLADRNPATRMAGLVLHSAARYDLLVWLLTLGRARAFHDQVLGLARLEPGESVLDVGCGTGTFAIAAKRRIGPAGTVYGIDASPEMLARANKKATKAGIDVVFKNAFAQALPFPDARFDAVLTTIMLHHLPRTARQQCACEIRRVLKPGGRVLAVDFGGSARGRRGPLTHFHRHGNVKLRDIIALLSEADLNSVKSGAVGIGGLQFVLAMAPRCT
jgi:ubiquinone/menaquinone biosynthesis C-methylase UbiE